MVPILIGGVVVFCIFAAVIMTGISQAKAHKENQLKDRLKSYYNRVRHHQDLLDAIPTKYLPLGMHSAIISDIIHTLNQALKLNSQDTKSQRLLSEYNVQLESLNKGERTEDTRVARNLSEAEGFNNLLQRGWKILISMQQEGQLSGAKLTEIKNELAYNQIMMNIDAELGIAENAFTELKLTSAHYHYHRATELLSRNNTNNQFDELIHFSSGKLAEVSKRIEANGDIVPSYDGSMSASKWDKFMQAEEDMQRPAD